MDFALNYKEVRVQQSQAAPCGCWMDCVEVGAALFVHHIPVLSCIFDLFQSILHTVNIAFAEGPEAISLEQGWLPFPPCWVWDPCPWACSGLGMSAAGALQVFPSANPPPDLSLPVPPHLMRLFGYIPGCKFSPCTLSALCHSRGCAGLPVNPHWFTRTLGKESACLKVKVAIKYLLRWP